MYRHKNKRRFFAVEDKKHQQFVLKERRKFECYVRNNGEETYIAGSLYVSGLQSALGMHDLMTKGLTRD